MNYVPELTNIKNKRNIPASYAQESFWLAEQLYANSGAFNEKWALRIKGTLNREILVNSFEKLFIRHKTLRTNILSEKGSLIQKVSDKLPKVYFKDISNLTSKDKRNKLMKISKELVNKSFELASETLIRVTLVKLNKNDHEVIFCAHHSIIDGWSVGIIISELKQIYFAALKGEPANLDQQRFDYLDYSYWQRNWLTGSAIQKQVDYWRKQLKDVEKILDLPTDFSRPAVISHKGNNIQVALSKDLSLQIEKIAMEEKVTPFMIFLTAYSVVLARISEQNELIIGTSTAGRKRSETKNIVGCFVNTLPLVVNIKDNPSIRTLISRVKQTSLEAYDNQDVPIEQLINELEIERDTSRTPLIQAMFAFLNFAVNENEDANGRLDFTYEDMPSNIAKFDMTLMFRKEKEVFKGSFEYSTDIFDRVTIKRVFEQIQMVLENMVKDIHQHVWSVPMRTQKEKKLFEQVNNNEKDVKYPTYIHQFQASVKKYKDYIALENADLRWTYKHLDEVSNRIASSLLNRQLETHATIGVIMHKSSYLIAVILGVWKAGYVFVPLDPELPEERLDFIAKDSSLSLVIIDSEYILKVKSNVTKVSVEHLNLDSGTKDFQLPSKEDTAYIIYTSGSTGKPKGVVIRHKGLPNLADAQSDVFRISSGDKVLQFASFSFDSAISEMTLALSNGACLIINSKYDMMPGEPLADLIEQKNISHMILVPSSLALLPERNYKSLKVIAVAGEECPNSLVKTWSKNYTMLNLYGPTENTIWSTYAELEYMKGKRTPIGKPVPNTEVYIVNEKNEIVPQGTPGELLIGGYALAEKYLGREELTKEKFVYLKTISNRLLYRSGDIIRMRNDGQLEFLSRKDTQVKLRGYRIELGEIESVIDNHPNVIQCSVLIDEDNNGDKRLVAFVVGSEEDLENDLFNYVKKQLPVYMVPSLIKIMPSLPYSISGKVDRKGLEASLNKFVTPDKKEEKDIIITQLTSIFEELLGISPIDPVDNFFEIGGHSLTATRLMARIRAIYEVDIPLGIFYGNPTVLGLKELLTKLAPSLGDSLHKEGTIPIAAEENRSIPSFGQERMWFIQQLYPESSAYHIPTKFYIEGELDNSALERAFNKIVDRHEVLKTSIILENNYVKTQLEKNSFINISIVDLSNLSESEKEEMLYKVSKIEAEKPFMLEKAPLFRATLVKLSPMKHCLLLTMHHVITDGWSISIFNKELKMFYSAELKRTSPQIPELPIQYADYAVWQKESVINGTQDKQISFWELKLKGIPRNIDLQTDFKRPSVFSQKGGHLEYKLKGDLAEAVKTIKYKAEVTTFTVLFSAFCKLLSKYADQDKFICGTPVSGRKRGELENLIGLFVNTLPIPVDFSHNVSIQETLKNIQTNFVECLENQDVPFEKLVEKLEEDRDLSRTALFQAMFVLQNAPVEAFKLDNLKVRMESNNPEATKFDLTLYAWEEDDSYQLLFSYAKDLYKEQTIQRMLYHLEDIILFMSQNLKKPFQQIPMLLEEEKVIHKELESLEINRPDEYFYKLLDKRIHDWPKGIAAEAEGVKWTFTDILHYSEEVENYLLESRIPKGSVIALEMQNSPQVIPLILGIWKFGSAFVPIDGSHPESRKKLILEETNAVLHIKDKASINSNDFKDLWSVEVLTPIGSINTSNLAYIIYTSGSTGKPKGIKVTHEGIPNLASSQTEIFQLNPNDRILQFAVLTFDAAISDLVMTLYSGATAVFVKNTELQGEALLDVIENKAIDVLKLPTSVIHFLPVREILSLRTLILGGENISEKTLELALSITNKVVNVYGVSEATGRSMYKEYFQIGQPSLGRPFPNTNIYILDSHLQKTPLGVEGDLYIGGIGLAEGYLNKKEQTDKHFITTQFLNQKQGKIYKTGDRALINEFGEVIFKGRKDHQVKIRSSRVELTEIATVLESLNQVAQAFVRSVSFGDMDTRLIAYVRSNNLNQLNTKNLRRELDDHLPEYMIPFSIIQIETFPLTQNGKIDQEKLPAIGKDTFKHKYSNNKENISDEVECKLLGIWSEVLGVSKIDLEDNFFDIGGNSLLLTRVHTMVKGLTSESISIIDLFANPTIKTLATKIKGEKGKKVYSDPIQVRSRRNIRSEQNRRIIIKEETYE